jgi:DNA-binding protein HU-alpha
MATKSTKSTKPALAAVQNTPKPSPESTTASAPKVAVVPKVDAEATDFAPKAETVKMKDLLTTVTTKTGAKKKDAKDVIDALLAEIAAALTAGKALSLPPLGNLRVAKTMDKGGSPMMVLRLRMGNSDAKAKDTNEALADEDEDN